MNDSIFHGKNKKWDSCINGPDMIQYLKNIMAGDTSTAESRKDARDMILQIQSTPKTKENPFLKLIDPVI